jgi:hypothetical protein
VRCRVCARPPTPEFPVHSHNGRWWCLRTREAGGLASLPCELSYIIIVSSLGGSGESHGILRELEARRVKALNTYVVLKADAEGQQRALANIAERLAASLGAGLVLMWLHALCCKRVSCKELV